MIKRIGLLLGLAGIGWYLYARLVKPQRVHLGDGAGPRPDEERGGIAGRVSQAASTAASTAARVAHAPVEKVRSLVGKDGEQEPAGEQAVTPEGRAEEAIAKMAAGSAPVGDRPAAEAAPQEGRQGDEATRESTHSAGQPSGGGQPSSVSARTSGGEGTGPVQAASEPEPEPEPAIKGNVRDNGEKIYHLPSDPAYERTNAEQMFSTVQEAEEAGFRRAGRPRAD